MFPVRDLYRRSQVREGRRIKAPRFRRQTTHAPPRTRPRACWLEYSWLQAVGFVLLVFGTFVYNKLIKLPCVDYDESPRDRVPTVVDDDDEEAGFENMDKLDDLAVEEVEPLTAGASAVDALRALGYGQTEAEAAVARARRELDGAAGTEELVRVALRHV